MFGSCTDLAARGTDAALLFDSFLTVVGFPVLAIVFFLYVTFSARRLS